LNWLARETKVEVLLRPYWIVDTAAQYHVCVGSILDTIRTKLFLLAY
jgi:hypothetical protein